MKNLPRSSRLLGILVVIAAVAAISVSSGPVQTDNGGGGLTFIASLSGAQEVPEVLTNTTGDIQVEFNDDLSAAEFTLSVFNGVEVTQAHFHCKRAGANGSVVAFLFGPASPPVNVNGELATGTLTNADILPVDCDGVLINNIASLAFAARDGLIYANVHTVANTGGEVRGQLNGGEGQQFAAALSGAQEVPQVVTSTAGNVQVGFNGDLSSAEFTLLVFDGMEVTQAHLHCRPAGVNGPVVAFLFGPAAPPVDVDGELSTGTITNSDITSRDCDGVLVNNIASLAAAARDGLVYANVHTIANSGGEVRGQLLPVVVAQAIPGDLNCDGETNIFDAILLLQSIVGLIELTACE